MIKIVNFRKLNPIQKKACQRLRLFSRKAGNSVEGCIIWPILSGKNEGGMIFTRTFIEDRLEHVIKK